MNLLLQTSNNDLQALIAVTGSKSETNRLLLLQALFPTIALANTSNSDDSEVMQMALNGAEEVIDIHHGNCNAISYRLFCSSRKPNGYFNGIE
jgi:3-phosphoshikimate 1-carboxyvinyltransferase